MIDLSHEQPISRTAPVIEYLEREIEEPAGKPARMSDTPKRKRRRFQFRLRTLMIVVALAAVANWVIVDRQRLAAERDHALRQLQVTEEANESVKANDIEIQTSVDERLRQQGQAMRQILQRLNALEGKSTQSGDSPSIPPQSAAK